MKKFFLRIAHWEQGLDQALQDIQAGKHRHDVLEQAIRALELDPADDSVGYGGFPNILGEMELDAVFMDGNNRMLGAVAGVKNFLPARIARLVMEEPEFHTLLTGDGAELFARAKGLKPEPVLSPEQHEKWQHDIKPLLDDKKTPLAELVKRLARPRKKENRDTTLMVASDGKGMSCAASTSGWPYKYPGRVSDAAVAGAGLYVDSRYGGCVCTWTGEMSMRAGTARYVVAQMESGKSPKEAVQSAIKDISSLAGGVLRTLAIHAINREGTAHAVAINPEQPIKYQFWQEGMPEPECRVVESVRIEWP